MELKSERLLTRRIGQVGGYAAIVNQHADLYGELFGALMGREVVLRGPTEKWIVWPAAGEGPDPREAELGETGIRVVGYGETDDGGYVFRVGRGVGV
jgi:hypothetical protein